MTKAIRPPSPDGLVRDYNGNPLPHLANCVRVLEDAMAETKTDGCLAFNDLSHTPELAGRPPWRDQASYDAATQVPDPDNPGQTIERKLVLDDHEMRLAQVMVQRRPEAPLAVGYDTAIQAVEMIARRHLFHPVRDWLRGLSWDGTNRVPNWMHNFIDAPESDYTSKVGSLTMIGAVARVMSPGCRFDTVTIFEGDQGLLKSTICETLGGPWYLDGLGSEARLNKEAVIAMAGSWVIELSEIDAHLRSNTASALKAFLSRRTDTFRPIYGRRATQVPRQSVFLGTTNRELYLTDHTGNRRFLPVPVFTRGSAPTVAPLVRVMDQLWAEAVVAYWVEGEEDMALLREETEDRLIVDELEDMVENYCRESNGWRSPVTSGEAASHIKMVYPWTANWTGMVERVATIFKRLGYYQPTKRGRDPNNPGHKIPRSFYHD
jgi:predicted P-loop ATPase